MRTKFHTRSALAMVTIASAMVAGSPLASSAQSGGAGAAPAAGLGATEEGTGATGGRPGGGPGAGSTLSGEAPGAVRIPTEPAESPSVVRLDYPTTAIADYVFACMATNGETQTALEQCSCSFDVVASIIPYERYVEASTWLSMRQVTGEKGTLFRDSAESKAAIGDLRRAQAEAEIRCFE